MKYLVTLAFTVISLCAASMIKPQPEIKIIKKGYSGSCTTSRYWDCCKPTCSWKGNIATKTGPVKSCAIDGSKSIDGNTQSGCESNGKAYMCSNQQSIIVNSTLAYGFAAAALIKPPENMCCTCMLVKFKKGKWGDCSGKQMIVQITNTGGSRSVNSTQNNIEIAMPGGGVGYYTLGCKRQWHASDHGWGDQYGGVKTEAECNQLPAVLRPGCKFRWTFLKGCSNPPATFQQVECPKEIVKISGCKMN